MTSGRSETRRRRISERGRGHLQGGTEAAAGGGIDSPNKNGELISEPVSANAHLSSTVQKKRSKYIDMHVLLKSDSSKIYSQTPAVCFEKDPTTVN